METFFSVPERIRGAWTGRISGCLLGKPVEVLSFRDGRVGLESYLRRAGAFPLRDYVPLVEGSLVAERGRLSCRGHISRPEPDEDINYTVLALLLLDDRGTAMCTEDVARAWLSLLPAGTTWTAEREAYRVLPDNPALVVWALCTFEHDLSAAIGNAVSAGRDTDCNGASVGGSFGLTCRPIPESGTQPWQGRVGVSLAGYSEIPVDDLVDRTVAVARTLQ